MVLEVMKFSVLEVIGLPPRNPSQNPEMMLEQNLFLGRIENPIQLQSCLGKNELGAWARSK